MNIEEYSNLRIAGNETIKIIYVVSLVWQEYDVYDQTILFVTSNKMDAEKYANKFNRVLKAWHKHYKNVQSTDKWLKEDLYHKNENRWDLLDRLCCANYILQILRIK